MAQATSRVQPSSSFRSRQYRKVAYYPGTLTISDSLFAADPSPPDINNKDLVFRLRVGLHGLHCA